MPILCLGMTVTSCSDFLDRPPLDQISPDSYYTTADQLGTFTINYYTSIFPNNSGWFAGVATFDDGTDNQAQEAVTLECTYKINGRYLHLVVLA